MGWQRLAQGLCPPRDMLLGALLWSCSRRDPAASVGSPRTPQPRWAQQGPRSLSGLTGDCSRAGADIDCGDTPTPQHGKVCGIQEYVYAHTHAQLISPGRASSPCSCTLTPRLALAFCPFPSTQDGGVCYSPENTSHT